MKKMLAIKFFLSIMLCATTLAATASPSSRNPRRVTFAGAQNLESRRTIDQDAPVTASVERLQTASPTSPAIRRRQSPAEEQKRIFNERFPLTKPQVIVKTDSFALVKERREIYCYRLFNGKIYRKDPNQSVWKSEEPVEAGAFLPTQLAVDDTSFQLSDDGQLEITFRDVTQTEEEAPFIMEVPILGPNTSTDGKTKYSERFEKLVFNAKTTADKEKFFTAFKTRSPLLAAERKKMPIKEEYLNSAFLALFLASEYFGWATKASDVLVEKSGLRSLVQKNAPESALKNPKTFSALASLAAFLGSAFIIKPLDDYTIIKVLLAVWPTYKITYAALKKNDAEVAP